MASIVTAENFYEELSPFPGWVLRNLMLMRQLDEKLVTGQTKLAELRSKFLRDLDKSSSQSRSRFSVDEFKKTLENTKDPLLLEIISLQEECTALCHEKLALVAKLETLVKGTQDNLSQACDLISNQDPLAVTSIINDPISIRNDSRRIRNRERPTQSELLDQSTRQTIVKTTNTLTTSVQKTNIKKSKATGSLAGNSIVSIQQIIPNDTPLDCGSSCVSVNESSCPLCNNRDNDLMVLCDNCQQWLHYICADYIPPVDPYADEPFYCASCLSKNPLKLKKKKKTGIIEI